MTENNAIAVASPIAPPAPVGSLVFIASFEHEHGVDFCSFTTLEGAHDWRRKIALTWWTDEFDHAPDATRDIGEQYFEQIENESFHIDENIVVERVEGYGNLTVEEIIAGYADESEDEDDDN